MPRNKAFRYGALLRVRRRQEEIKALALAHVRGEIRRAEDQRAFVLGEQRRILEEAGRAAQKEFDAADVHRYYQYERHLARLAVEKDADLAQLRRTEETRRAELEDAMKRKRIVERLEERYAEALAFEFRREEQKFTDEVASNQAARTGGKRAGPPGLEHHR